MPYMVICQKADGAIEVAAFPGDAPPELLQDAQAAQSVDEAAQLVKDVLGAQQQQAGTVPDESEPGQSGDGDVTGAEGMPMEDEDDRMAAGFQRAKKGY